MGVKEERINDLMKFGYNLGKLDNNIRKGIDFLAISEPDNARDFVKNAENDFGKIFKEYEAEVKKNFANIPFAQDCLTNARYSLVLYQELRERYL